MNIEDFKKRKWVLFGAPATPIMGDTFATSPARGFIPVFGSSCEVLCLSRGNYLEWFYDEDQIATFSEKVLPSLLEDPWAEYAICRQVAEEYGDVHDALMKKDISALTDTELDHVTREYVRIFEKQFTINNIIEPIGFYFQDRFPKLLLSAGVNTDDVHTLMNAYGRSKYPNYVKLCLSEYESAENESERQSVLDRYSYLMNDYLGVKTLTKEYIEELRQQQSHEPESYGHIAVSDRAQKLLDVFQFLATLQDVRKKESLMMVSGVYFLLDEYSRRMGIPADVLLYALWEEILAGSIDESRLRERMIQCAFFWGSTKTEIFEGEESEEFSLAVRTFMYGNSDDADEIKGVCASPGKVSGRAVVVMQPDEFHKVQAGDILFTMMTRPEFLPVMQLASAFVTDEGGITSHAAIVAREMRKSCIVATKTGTKIVKDGDLVEVDANEGIVKILQRI